MLDGSPEETSYLYIYGKGCEHTPVLLAGSRCLATNRELTARVRVRGKGFRLGLGPKGKPASGRRRCHIQGAYDMGSTHPSNCLRHTTQVLATENLCGGRPTLPHKAPLARIYNAREVNTPIQ